MTRLTAQLPVVGDLLLHVLERDRLASLHQVRLLVRVAVGTFEQPEVLRWKQPAVSFLCARGVRSARE